MAVRKPLFALPVNDTSLAARFGRKLQGAFHGKKSLPWHLKPFALIKVARLVRFGRLEIATQLSWFARSGGLHKCCRIRLVRPSSPRLGEHTFFAANHFFQVFETMKNFQFGISLLLLLGPRVQEEQLVVCLRIIRTKLQDALEIWHGLIRLLLPGIDAGQIEKCINILRVECDSMFQILLCYLEIN